MSRFGPGPRAALAIVVILAGATVGLVAASARSGGGGDGGGAKAPGLRANLLPGDLDRSPAPRIRLRDASGEAIDSGTLTGRPYLVTFVYTRCKDVCPLMGSEIADAFADLGPRARDAAALAVSVDPRHDTPAAARRWLRLHRLPDQAHYLVGSSAELTPVWRDWFVVPENGTLADPTTHDASIWLVDAKGRLRGRWSGGAPIDPADIAHDLRALMDEQGGA